VLTRTRKDCAYHFCKASASVEVTASGLNPARRNCDAAIPWSASIFNGRLIVSGLFAERKRGANSTDGEANASAAGHAGTRASQRRAACAPVTKAQYKRWPSVQTASGSLPAATTRRLSFGIYLRVMKNFGSRGTGTPLHRCCLSRMARGLLPRTFRAL